VAAVKKTVSKQRNQIIVSFERLDK